MSPAAIFLRALGQLKAMLEKIAATGDATLGARLHPDMLPFASQVRASANFALRGCCPLAGLQTISFQREEISYPALAAQIEDTMQYLAALPAALLDDAPDRICHDRAGLADIALPADEYLNLYILPNFYFHLSMAYAIARAQGADIGKADYDGYHHYAPGFSFESTR